MTIELVIAAAALAGASASMTLTGRAADYDLHENEIIVEARKGTLRDWTMPELDYSEPDSCLLMIERQIPGFGTFSLGPDCSPEPSDRSGWWPL
jgi:hypothetical protein